MPLTLATWNINSVRLRAPIVEALMTEEKPDVLCLQETKSPVEKVPTEPFETVGYHLITARGFKGYNGVAIFSRVGGTEVPHFEMCGKDDARHCAVKLRDGTILHNFYVPAGGDVADREVNDKFGHKLDFIAEMTEWSKGLKGKHVVVGDLNIAALETDVWSPNRLPASVQSYPGRNRSHDGTDAGRRLGRRNADRYPGTRETVFLVVLSLERLGSRRQGPQARPHLGAWRREACGRLQPCRQEVARG